MGYRGVRGGDRGRLGRVPDRRRPGAGSAGGGRPPRGRSRAGVPAARRPGGAGEPLRRLPVRAVGASRGGAAGTQGLGAQRRRTPPGPRERDHGRRDARRGGRARAVARRRGSRRRVRRLGAVRSVAGRDRPRGGPRVGHGGRHPVPGQRCGDPPAGRRGPPLRGPRVDAGRRAQAAARAAAAAVPRHAGTRARAPSRRRLPPGRLGGDHPGPGGVGPHLPRPRRPRRAEARAQGRPGAAAGRRGRRTLHRRAAGAGRAGGRGRAARRELLRRRGWRPAARTVPHQARAAGRGPPGGGRAGAARRQPQWAHHHRRHRQDRLQRHRAAARGDARRHPVAHGDLPARAGEPDGRGDRTGRAAAPPACHGCPRLGRRGAARPEARTGTAHGLRQRGRGRPRCAGRPVRAAAARDRRTGDAAGERPGAEPAHPAAHGVVGAPGVVAGRARPGTGRLRSRARPRPGGGAGRRAHRRMGRARAAGRAGPARLGRRRSRTRRAQDAHRPAHAASPCPCPVGDDRCFAPAGRQVPVRDAGVGARRASPARRVPLGRAGGDPAARTHRTGRRRRTGHRPPRRTVRVPPGDAGGVRRREPYPHPRRDAPGPQLGLHTAPRRAGAVTPARGRDRPRRERHDARIRPLGAGGRHRPVLRARGDEHRRRGDPAAAGGHRADQRRGVLRAAGGRPGAAADRPAPPPGPAGARARDRKGARTAVLRGQERPDRVELRRRARAVRGQRHGAGPRDGPSAAAARGAAGDTGDHGPGPAAARRLAPHRAAPPLRRTGRRRGHVGRRGDRRVARGCRR
ncbi:hypothetical protein EES45_08460 [Streptomyces sp. ADI97-07]|nr:hypothetical protein EES45_08460 [Streptomyces sp. ADI97-07]